MVTGNNREAKITVHFSPPGKILAALLIILAGLFANLQSRPVFAVFVLLLFSFFYLAFKLDKKVVKYSLRTLIMLTLLAVILPFKPLNSQDQVWWQMGNLVVYKLGSLRFASILIKGWFVVLVVFILSKTTSVYPMIAALGRFGLPDWVLSILFFMVRLLVVMQHEFERMARAVTARGGVRSIKQKFRFASGFSVVFLSRLIERSDRNFKAMVSRGFSGSLAPVEKQVSIGFYDWLLMGMAAFFMGMCLLWL